MEFSITDIIILSGIGLILLLVIAFRGRVRSLEIGGNKITLEGQNPQGPILDPGAARLYTRETIRLTKLIGDLERRVMLSEMMRHGEEGLTMFCNMTRADFREFIYDKGYSQDLIDDYAHENELVVNQIDREMHGWILLAMRQNNIPLDENHLEKYVMEKFEVWDGETDEIRRKFGKTREIHREFLVWCRQHDQKYVKAIFSMFKKAAKAEEEVKGKIECAVKARQDLEDHFSVTAQVKPVGCESDDD